MEMTGKELDALGLLKTVAPVAEVAWLSPEEKQLIVEILTTGGATGFPRKVAEKRTRKSPDTLFKLEANGLTQWDFDARGRPAYYVLTWKGQELGEQLLRLAKHENRKVSKR
ncbi:hypothetical protein F6X40_17075 [Paraburkholderia sp. UCT31]|uniref:hypothetical protein n=1 Tax=Paraburkholderia sp. UCT31 TaxID=2615209 RepID=UPI0016564928|nr:hypothetical protein [Paraburkholderia sp. UCT31]MBC8738488.1 hypothetical protein [Paraburkholderia sp. UCT31]